MLTETYRIKVSSEGELARLLEEADNRPLLLEKDGELYRLTKEEGKSQCNVCRSRS